MITEVLRTGCGGSTEDIEIGVATSNGAGFDHSNAGGPPDSDGPGCC